MFKNLKNFFLNLFFPIECYSCKREGFYLCKNCFKKIKFLEKSSHDFNLSRNNLKEIFIAGDYEDKILAKLITAFKYEGIIELFKPLGKFLNFFWAGRIKIISLENKALEKKLEEALIIPVPLTRRRFKERGFNQAELLAKILAKEFSYELYLNLKRKGRKKNQAKLNEESRLKNIRGQFFIEKKNSRYLCPELRNKTIILIDDVITTGATLNEIARVLKEAGAQEVYALVLAKG